jgi:hypothetical protein
MQHRFATRSSIRQIFRQQHWKRCRVELIVDLKATQLQLDFLRQRRLLHCRLQTIHCDVQQLQQQQQQTTAMNNNDIIPIASYLHRSLIDETETETSQIDRHFALNNLVVANQLNSTLIFNLQPQQQYICVFE